MNRRKCTKKTITYRIYSYKHSPITGNSTSDNQTLKKEVSVWDLIWIIAFAFYNWWPLESTVAPKPMIQLFPTPLFSGIASDFNFAQNLPFSWKESTCCIVHCPTIERTLKYSRLDICPTAEDQVWYGRCSCSGREIYRCGWSSVRALFIFIWVTFGRYMYS